MDLNEIIEVLACPKCHESLLVDKDKLICNSCHLGFSIENGIPDLLIEDAISLNDIENATSSAKKYWDDEVKAAKYLTEISPRFNYINISEINEVLFSLNLKGNEFVLDAGCGSGRHLAEISKTNKIIGIDRSITMLERAKKESNRKNSFFMKADLLNLPFKENVFNLVNSVRVFQHLDNYEQEASLEEFCRVLKRGGKAFVTNYNRNTPHWWYIKISTTWLRYIFNLPFFITSSIFYLPMKILGYNSMRFRNPFRWDVFVENNFTSLRSMTTKYNNVGFKLCYKRSFQVGDVLLCSSFYIEYLLMRFFPKLIEAYYEKALHIDNKIRNKKSFLNKFLFKDKVIVGGMKE